MDITFTSKGSTLEVGNYRPISVLTTISKLIEKAVYPQVDTYLTQKNLIYKFQSGFRRNYSTNTCLVYLTDLIKSEITNGNLWA